MTVQEMKLYTGPSSVSDSDEALKQTAAATPRPEGMQEKRIGEAIALLAEHGRERGQHRRLARTKRRQAA